MGNGQSGSDSSSDCYTSGAGESYVQTCGNTTCFGDLNSNISVCETRNDDGSTSHDVCFGDIASVCVSDLIAGVSSGDDHNISNEYPSGSENNTSSNNLTSSASPSISPSIIPSIIPSKDPAISYINKFIQDYEMNEANTTIALKRIIDLYNSNAVAKDIIQDAYISWFKTKFEMNEINTGIAITRCIEMGIPFKTHSENGVKQLKLAYFNWFVHRFEMNEINVQIAKQRLTNLGFILQDEPAKQLLKTSYEKWFRNKFEMNNINNQILKDRLNNLF
jgi:hypothetical protein